MTFQAQIITLYPEMFPGPLGRLAGRSRAGGGEVVLLAYPAARLCERQAPDGG